MLEFKKISDYVYDEILKNIVELKYAPGEKLSEAKLAEELGVSRSPVKTAFSKLEASGLVDVRPQYGTFVSEIFPERAKDICEIRLMLEKYAVREAVKKITDQQLAEMEKLFEQLDHFSGDEEEHLALIHKIDGQMHEMIYRASGNKVIEEVIDRYRLEIQRIQYANMKWAKRKDSSQEEIRAILEGLRSRDEEAAQAAMERHLINIKETAEALQIDSSIPDVVKDFD